MPSGNLSLQVQLNMQDALKGLQSVGNAFSGFASKVGGGQLPLLNFTNAISALVDVFNLLVDGIKAAIAAMVEWIDVSIEATFAEQKLNAVLESTEHAAKLTFDQIKEYSRELGGNSIYAMNRYVEASSRIAFFTNIQEDNFKRALDAAGDLSALIGSSLPQAALQLGRSLNDPKQGLELLAQSGITFTKSQKEMIMALHETGAAAKAQALQLEFLEERIGSVAEEMRDSGAGAFVRLGNVIQDFKREAGQELTEALRPAIESVIAVIEELVVLVDSGALDNITDTINSLAVFIEKSVQALRMAGEDIEKLNKYGALSGAANAATMGVSGGIGSIFDFMGRYTDILEGMEPDIWEPTSGPGKSQREAALAAIEFKEALEKVTEEAIKQQKILDKRYKAEESLAEKIKSTIDPAHKLNKEFELMQFAISDGFITMSEATQYLEQQQQALRDKAKKDEEEDKGFKASLVGLEEAGSALQELAASREEDKVEKAITETAKRAEEQRKTQIGKLGDMINELKKGIVARAG